MTQYISCDATWHFSPTVSLVALGAHLHQIDLFGPVRDIVQIAQEIVKHTPLDKLYDAFIIAGHTCVQVTITQPRQRHRRGGSWENGVDS